MLMLILWSRPLLQRQAIYVVVLVVTQQTYGVASDRCVKEGLKAAIYIAVCLTLLVKVINFDLSELSGSCHCTFNKVPWVGVMSSRNSHVLLHFFATNPKEIKYFLPKGLGVELHNAQRYFGILRKVSETDDRAERLM